MAQQHRGTLWQISLWSLRVHRGTTPPAARALGKRSVHPRIWRLITQISIIGPILRSLRRVGRKEAVTEPNIQSKLSCVGSNIRDSRMAKTASSSLSFIFCLRCLAFRLLVGFRLLAVFRPSRRTLLRKFFDVRSLEFHGTDGFDRSIIFIVGFFCLVPLAIFRLASKASRSTTLIRPAVFILVRIATYVVRVIQATGK